jgi:hypothetical protein
MRSHLKVLGKGITWFELSLGFGLRIVWVGTVVKADRLVAVVKSGGNGGSAQR